MTRLDSWRILPHEIAFALFWISGTVRLVMRQGWGGDAILFTSLLLVSGALILLSLRLPHRRWTMYLRLLYFPLAINLTYAAIRTAVPAMTTRRWDLALQKCDETLLGGHPSLWLQSWVNPWATEILSFCYLTFFAGLLLSWIHYYRRDLGLARLFTAGFFTVYGLGFLGYTLIPAAGPHLDPAFAARYTVPLEGWVFTKWNAALVEAGSNRVDVFPSLHTAVTAFLLGFDRRFAPRRFRLWLVPTVGLWLSTIYLRYHYVTDVVAGFALAGFALWLTRYLHAPDPHPTSSRRHEPAASL
jgi:membrane-associated phospholipid phosphatase